jgi:hypothetical protein
VVVVVVVVVVEVVVVVVTVDVLVGVAVVGVAAVVAAVVAAAVIAAETAVALFPEVVGAGLKLLEAEATAVPVTTFCATAAFEFDVGEIATCWPPTKLIEIDGLTLLLF